MANPTTKADMEDVALEYIKAAMQSTGAYGPANPTMAAMAEAYFRGLYRGIWHFLDDHMFIDDTTSVITVNGIPQDIYNKFITEEDSAWMN